MTPLKDNYQLLIEKLDEFIRKYYINQTIRGSLYAVGLILALFLGLNFAENFFYFPAAVRKGLFWSFVGGAGVSLWAWVGVPMLHFFRLGKVISHEQAAQIVGNHFGNVKDKLLNILQLRKQAEATASGRDLIMASVRQKSEEIKPVPFQSAINLYQNKKYLRYALPPLMLLLFVLFAAPSILRDGTRRLFNYDKEYEREAPFKFVVDKNALKVAQFQDYDLTVKIDGKVLPNEVFINMNGYEYRLTKKDNTTFGYKFTNVQKDQPFKLTAGTVASPNFLLGVLKKPNIANFDVTLRFPSYINRNTEVLSNTGDLVVPIGTTIEWSLNATNTDRIAFQFGTKSPTDAQKQATERFTIAKKATTDELYKLLVSNNLLQKSDSIGYAITVIPDLFPTINVEKFDDSLNKKRIYFVGDASDDYGVKNLSFNYQIKKQGSQQGAMQKIPLPSQVGKSTAYQFTLNVDDLKLQAGDELTYFFEIFDNDAVNGSKSARTSVMAYSVPSTEQIEKQTAKNNEEIKADLKKAIEESKKIQEETKKLREKLLQKKDIDFQTKKEAENLVKRQQELEEKIAQAKANFDENKENQENQQQQNQEQQQNEEIQKKQEAVEKMFEELQKNDELRDLLKQIEELMQKMDKEQALQKMDEFKMSNEQLEKELDKMQELFKQLEVEAAMQDQIKELEKLAEQQEKLAEKTEKNQDSQENLKKEQEDINKKFDELQKKQEDLEKKNAELSKPNDMPDTKQDQKEVDKDLKDSKENLNQKENQKASKSQKSAGKKMKDMANKMQQAMQESQQEQAEEDIKALRQLLENLVNLSFDQEALMADFGKAVENTPRFISLTKQQNKLKGDFEMIEDSLQALSKRVVQIQGFVNEKVTDIKQDMNSSLKRLEDRQKQMSVQHQQKAMKNINDLALMLAESMNQMQQEMQGKKEGQAGSCKKPGGKNPKGSSGKEPSDKLGEGQKQLNQQLKDMKERMGKGGQGTSKEFAEMAAKQAAIRKALQEKQKELQQRGKGDKGMQQAIDAMDKTETELVNKRLSNDVLKRQEDILTRLLESEKAERERGEDEKRKADVAKERRNEPPASLQEYLKKRQAEVETYRTVSPNLKPYYKQLVEEYYKGLKGR